MLTGTCRQDFLARMDEAEVRISNVEDTVNSEKNKSDALVKQVALLTNKLLSQEVIGSSLVL